jgi:hypothetical protein
MGVLEFLRLLVLLVLLHGLAPELFGADAHSIYVAASAASPAFGAASVDFNGFTARLTTMQRLRTELGNSWCFIY